MMFTDKLRHRKVSNSDFIYTFTFSSFFLLSFICQFSTSETCTYVSPCKCQFQNRSTIDLTSLGDRNNARFQNVSAKTGPYRYYYNPCFSFSLGPADAECAKGVAVCQVNAQNSYFDCGDQEHANFQWNSINNTINLIYTASPRTTNVTLVCSSEVFTPVLEVIGEIKPNHYEMTLTTRCACPDLCSEKHLSAGSVLVIIFMIFVALYLVLGIIHSSLTRGAHGWELIPHYEFWVDFPLLVRDGCVFVFSGCKPDTAYERI